MRRHTMLAAGAAVAVAVAGYLVRAEPGLAQQSATAPRSGPLQTPAPPVDVGPQRAEAPAIRALLAQGILTNAAGKRFAPDDTVRGGDFAIALQRMFNLPVASTTPAFTDVPPSSPYFRAVQAVAPYLHRQALCPGCALSSNFGPRDPVSSAQAAITLTTILVAAKKLRLLGPDESAKVLAGVANGGIVPSAARRYIATAIANGILRLAPDRTLPAQAKPTRAQFADQLYTAQRRFFITAPSRSNVR